MMKLNKKLALFLLAVGVAASATVSAAGTRSSCCRIACSESWVIGSAQYKMCYSGCVQYGGEVGDYVCE